MVAGEAGISKPALGESWKNIPHVRLMLSRRHGTNVSSISLLKHTYLRSTCYGGVTFHQELLDLKLLKFSIFIVYHYINMINIINTYDNFYKSLSSFNFFFILFYFILFFFFFCKRGVPNVSN
ncbi:hypothetical protein ACJIZ3_012595 [Penstemon smallii]|uniref:Uncharacterized protein n=1 Tax=Penstemon smallii TaxID=265156 RepID=A0ABD3URQ6_9LAMI